MSIGKLIKEVGPLPIGAWVIYRDGQSGHTFDVQGACDAWSTWRGCGGDSFSACGRAREAVFRCDETAGTWRELSGVSRDLGRVVNGYLTAALWSSTDSRYPEGEEVGGDDQPFDDWAGILDCTDRLIVHALADCSALMAEVGGAFERYCARRGSAGDGSSSAECFGHDFWLTRNRHGCGFWDRGLDALGEYLTDAAHRYGSVDIYSQVREGADDEIDEREVTI